MKRGPDLDIEAIFDDLESDRGSAPVVSPPLDDLTTNDGVAETDELELSDSDDLDTNDLDTNDLESDDPDADDLAG